MNCMLSRHQEGLLATPASSASPVSSECAEGYEGDKCDTPTCKHMDVRMEIALMSMFAVVIMCGKQ